MSKEQNGVVESAVKAEEGSRKQVDASSMEMDKEIERQKEREQTAPVKEKLTDAEIRKIAEAFAIAVKGKEVSEPKVRSYTKDEDGSPKRTDPVEGKYTGKLITEPGNKGQAHGKGGGYGR